MRAKVRFAASRKVAALVAVLGGFLGLSVPCGATEYIVVLSSKIPTNGPTYADFEALIRETKPGDVLKVLSAPTAAEEAVFTIPTSPYPNARFVQNTKAIAELKRFLANAAPSSTDHSRLQIPELLRQIRPTQPIKLLMLGDPLYRDSEKPDYSMSMDNGIFPSDGHFNATVLQSRYSLQGRENVFKGSDVHIVPWDNAIPPSYLNVVVRFWSLYFTGQGAKLVSFSQDWRTGFRNLMGSTQVSGERLSRDAVCANTSMLTLECLRRQADPNYCQCAFETTPSNEPKIIRLGVKSCRNCKMDLYVRSVQDRTRDWLYFGEQRTSIGVHQCEPNNCDAFGTHQFVELTSGIRPEDVIAAVNLYNSKQSGQVPECEFYVSVEGKTQTRKLRFEQLMGDFGMNMGNMENSKYWIVFRLSDHLSVK